MPPCGAMGEVKGCEMVDHTKKRGRRQVKKIDDVTIIIYETPEKALMAMFEVNNPKDVANMGGVDEHGNEVEYSLAQAVDGIIRTGVWGFCKPSDNTVHAWIGTGAKVMDVVSFLAHEMGHLQPPSHEDDMEEEQKAIWYEVVGRKAFETAIASGHGA